MTAAGGVWNGERCLPKMSDSFVGASTAHIQCFGDSKIMKAGYVLTLAVRMFAHIVSCMCRLVFLHVG